MQVAGTHTFTLIGSDGAPHNYLVHEHPAGEGMAIMYELLGLGAPTLVGLVETGIKSTGLIRAALGALGGGDDAKPTAGALMQRVSDADLADLVKLVEDLDLSSVGAEIGKALGTGKAPELTRKVLARTWRDGASLAPGSKTHDFEVAYQANYWELLQAVWKVCQLNGFFPVPSTSASSPSASTKG